MDVTEPRSENASQPVLLNIQVLRFLAASAILLSHTADLLIPKQSWFWAVPWTAGVDVFFVISGFIMAHLTRNQFGRNGASRQFLLRRLARIVPAYWFFTLLLAVIILASGGRIRNSVASLDVMLSSIFFIPWPRIDGKLNPLLAQGWSLNFEMIFYMAFSAALIFRSGRLYLVAGMVLLASSHWLVPESWFALKFWTRPIILEFVIGIGLAHIHARGIRMGWLSAVTCLLLSVAIFKLAPAAQDNDYLRLIKIGIPAALFAAVFILSREPTGAGPMRKLLLFGGDASYAIYLSHTLTMAAFVAVWQRLPIAAPWLGTLLAVLASLGVAMAFHAIIERPFNLWLKRRLGKANGSVSGNAVEQGTGSGLRF